jgi:4-amino-4-deoxy-L-arabinose transferase-like glycosyltransferase
VTAILSGVVSVAIGQVILVALAPLSRAGSPGVTPSGVALLSADSEGYLTLAASPEWAGETPWNRLLLIAVLRAGTLLGDASTTLVMIQVVSLVVAASLIHQLTARFAGQLAGHLAALIVGANPLTAQWVRFVLSETLMFSLVLIALWAAVELRDPLRSRLAAAALLSVSTMAAFLRPNGLLVLGSALTLLSLDRASRHKAIIVAGIWSAIVGGLLLGLLAAGQPSERSLTEQLHAGVVIEGTNHVLVERSMPVPRDPSDISLGAGVAYALRHPAAVGGLVFSRIAVEVAQIRRHYPVPVNIGIGVAMVLLLGFAVIGSRQPDTTELRRATLILGVPILLLVGLTFATPEGRYGWAALVALAPLAAIGAARILPGPLLSPRADQVEPGPGIAR